MSYDEEKDFESALVALLAPSKGWNENIICYPTEAELIRNWANILYENNRGIDKLNGQPLTESEMGQVMEQVRMFKTPLRLNGFINGKSLTIKRDNPKDTLHYGKEVSLSIYDRNEIAGGKSRYQIVRQPKFESKSKILSDRRGDVMLLINGMPLIHVELKRSGVPVSRAAYQIEKYSHEGIFSGIFSLVQIFVAMTPEETLYFANPGPEGRFNPDYYFHWADFNNNPVNDWKLVASQLLSIPMAHQLIGFYTVADQADGVLKVMRSYQYYAAAAISDHVKEIHWGENNLLGGYIWHTTGSGKTMTSFKSACLIADSNHADKVVFLVDRIELGNQSLKEFQGFAEHEGDVVDTDSTFELISRLKNEEDVLIVTSIQKMSNIDGEEGVYKQKDIDRINRKRLVFIIDECHRNTFGDMLIQIKRTFPRAVIFGFTGTPIHVENQKKLNTTSTVFGNELHRYTLGNAIPDKNVLGFDPYMVLTFRDKDLRTAVALEKSKASTVEEAIADPKKAKVFYHYMNDLKMAGYKGRNGKYVKGIEDYVPTAQYETEGHRETVVQDILDNWVTLSRNGKFHALFATSSIPEAIAYYRLLKKKAPYLKVVALFDPTIDNNGSAVYKEDGLEEIIKDYNERYNMKFKMATYHVMKKDISARLAHKEPYLGIHKTPEKQIDLLVVVDQMLTGFDSKWLNTLYLDKVQYYEHLIQAFSRTNRLFGPDKPFGTIRYYRYPHTMARNIEDAVALYSGDKPQGLFVERLEYNLNKMNAIMMDIKDLFESAGIENFDRLPDDYSERGRFAQLFNDLNKYLEAARIQGFTWNKLHWKFEHGKGKAKTVVDVLCDEQTYNILLSRYKELVSGSGGGDGFGVPFDVQPYLTEIDTGQIDADYMNSRFEKWLKVLGQPDVDEQQLRKTLDELHRSFATLTQEEQEYAYMFLHDVESGDVKMVPGKTLRDYITEYRSRAKNDRIHRFADALGLNEEKLRAMMMAYVTENNINDFGRFDDLKASVDKEKAREYFEAQEGKKVPPPLVIVRLDRLLRQFILEGDFERPQLALYRRMFDARMELNVAHPAINEELLTAYTLSDWMVKERKSGAARLSLEQVGESVFLVGCIRDVEHFKWIFGKKTYNVVQGLYNVRQGQRHGAVKRTEDVVHAEYVVLYNIDDPGQYLVYRLKEKHHVWDEVQMKENQYENPHGKYYIYGLAEQIDLSGIDVRSLLKRYLEDADKGKPVYLRGDDLGVFLV